jgi:hypothetical protein
LQIRILLEINDIIKEMAEIAKMFIFFTEKKVRRHNKL